MTLRDVATLYNQKKTNLHRHRTQHMGMITARNGTFAAAKAQHVLAGAMAGASIVAQMKHLADEAERYRATAEANRDLKLALLALDRTSKLLELQGRLVLEASQMRAQDLTVHPVWLEVSSEIMAAIRPCDRCTREVHARIKARLGREATPQANAVDADVPFPE